MSDRIFSTDEQIATAVVNGGAGSLWLASGASLQADASASDDVRASVLLGTGANSQLLKCTGFGFDALMPARAQVVGALLRVERSKSGTGSVVDKAIRMLFASSVRGNDQKSASVWPTTDAVVLYGSPTDLWGNVISYADIQNSGFGFSVRGNNSDLFNSATARVDRVTAELFYRLPAIIAMTKKAGSALDGSQLSRHLTNFRTDGSGGATLYFDGGNALPIGATIERIVIVADAGFAPSANWDVTLEEPGGLDLLNGASLNRAVAEDSSTVLYDPAAGTTTREPIVVRAAYHRLVIANAGQDAAGLISLYLRMSGGGA